MTHSHHPRQGGTWPRPERPAASRLRQRPFSPRRLSLFRAVAHQHHLCRCLPSRACSALGNGLLLFFHTLTHQPSGPFHPPPPPIKSGNKLVHRRAYADKCTGTTHNPRASVRCAAVVVVCSTIIQTPRRSSCGHGVARLSAHGRAYGQSLFLLTQPAQWPRPVSIAMQVAASALEQRACELPDVAVAPPAACCRRRPSSELSPGRHATLASLHTRSAVTLRTSHRAVAFGGITPPVAVAACPGSPPARRRRRHPCRRATCSTSPSPCAWRPSRPPRTRGEPVSRRRAGARARGAS